MKLLRRSQSAFAEKKQKRGIYSRPSFDSETISRPKQADLFKFVRSLKNEYKKKFFIESESQTFTTKILSIASYDRKHL
jgi:hypothetical protein